MKDFLTLNDADRLIASIAGDPVFAGKARRLAGNGTLKISFYYRGPIGVFPIAKVPNPDTKAVKKYSFNGYLTAVARPQLDLPTEKISSKGIKKQHRDRLTVREVTLGQGILPTEPGYSIGRVRTWLDGDRLIRHTTDNLDSSLLPVSKWRIASDEIRAVFQKSPATGNVEVRTGGDGQVPITLGTKAAPIVDDWRNRVRAEAWEQWVKTLAENGTPTLENVSKHLATWCKKEGIRGNLGNFPQASYLKQHVIGGKHWGPPRNMSREKAKEHLEQKKQEKQAKKNK